MIIINELISNFTQILNNQKRRYKLKMGQEPFNLLSNFTEEDLLPPLLLIKNDYNIIEENILNEIFKLIEDFPNYELIIKEKLNLELIPDKIISIYNLIDKKIIEYREILDKEIKSYFYKLIHYTFINGLDTYDEPCNESFCLIDLKEIMDNTEENNDNNKGSNSQQASNSNNSNYFYNYLFNTYINQTKINELRNQKFKNLVGYDSTMGSIEEDEIEKYILKIQDTLFNFNNSYLSKEYINIQTKSDNYINKEGDLYLAKLKKHRIIYC